MTFSVGTSLFIEIRKLILPFSKVEEYVPKKGKTLDVGCGHGTFTRILSKEKDRQIVGIDPSVDKIRQAKILSKNIKNLKFKVGYLDKLRDKDFDCITVIDVLYLLPYTEKVKFLRTVKSKLTKGGRLVLKEIESENGKVSLLLLFEEFLMTKIFKLTYSDYKKTEFTTNTKYKSLLKSLGFRSIDIRKFRGILPYKHVLFVAE